jgi:alpha-mannosidase
MNMEKKIYTIATAHLDTVWNWDFEHVINVCLKETLDQNFNHFSKYPDYRFNFEGSYRYELFEEYYPEKFEQLREYVNQGKWNVTGSAYENGDVNVPSPESLFRNILYGNKYFEKKFGKKSNDIFLPDCFGFGYALPSIMNHAGLKGFSTQKLSWGSAYGIPYDIGLWYGPDEKYVFASLDAKSYCTTFHKIRTKKSLLSKLDHNIKNHDLPVTFAYHGVGDVGGAPKEESVKTLTKEMADNDREEIKVLSSSPTEFFDDMAALGDEAIKKLPVWKNELPMTDHGVGSYVSRAFSKRMNRRNEEIADMAERNSVIAMTTCGTDYPKEEIEKGWKRTIAHTFHDDITGTSVERV